MIQLYDYEATTERVVDGDSVILVVDVGFRISHCIATRLIGINAPERGKPGWSEANAYLASLLMPAGTPLTVRTAKDPRDKYGRWLAEIWRRGEVVSVNRMMVENGHAVPYMV